MNVISTRDWPQGALDYLRQINRRELLQSDFLPVIPAAGRKPKTVVLRVKKVSMAAVASNGRRPSAGKVGN